MAEKTKKEQRLNLQSVMLIILILLGAIVVILLQTQNTSFNMSGISQVRKGQPAPNFTLPDINGNPVTLEDLKGKVVLLNIWATWCPPCVEEMPSMEKLHRTLNNDQFIIIAISIDASGTKVVGPFMKKHNLTFQTLIDETGKIKTLYQTAGVPESYVIDKNGVIVEKVIGPADWAAPDVIEYFKKLTKEA